MVELVDTQDLKSCGHLPVRVRFPLLVHKLRPLQNGATDLFPAFLLLCHVECW